MLLGTWADHYHIGAHLRQVGPHTLLRALTYGHHYYHGCHANDDAQHGQERTEFIAGHGSQCHLEKIQ